MSQTSLIPSERIEQRIILIRGQRVMLDYDLASLYGVESKVLNQAVKRNVERFPDDFMFQLSWEEARLISRSQIVTLKQGQHRKFRPHAFTEQGVAMLSSVLNSPRAVQVNIAIMRAFVQLRQMLSSNAGLARKLNTLEKKYDAHFRVVFDAIRGLMKPVFRKKSRRQIGFYAIQQDHDEKTKALSKTRISA